jgi:RNA polymerase sigma factor (sigma-70 family)
MASPSSALVADGKTDSQTISGSFDEPELFAGVFDRHYDAVHRYLARRVPRSLADDLASSTFVVAFERRRSFRVESTSARPWLLGIATNLLRERVRLERRELDTALRLQADGSAGSDHRDGEAESREIEMLAQALAEIDPSQRDVLLLYAWEELSYEEIAQALDVPIGTVRSRLARARAHLRSRLTPPQSHPEERP